MGTCCNRGDSSQIEGKKMWREWREINQSTRAVVRSHPWRCSELPWKRPWATRSRGQPWSEQQVRWDGIQSSLPASSVPWHYQISQEWHASSIVLVFTVLRAKIVYQIVWILLSPQAMYSCLFVGGNTCFGVTGDSVHTPAHSYMEMSWVCLGRKSKYL